MDKNQKIITVTEFSVKIALLKKHYICHSGYISTGSTSISSVWTTRTHAREAEQGDVLLCRAWIYSWFSAFSVSRCTLLLQLILKLLRGMITRPWCTMLGHMLRSGAPMKIGKGHFSDINHRICYSKTETNRCNSQMHVDGMPAMVWGSTETVS